MKEHDRKIAEKLKRWVFHEVPPSIRKTGKYQIPEEYLQITQEKINEMVKNVEIPSNIGSVTSLAQFMGSWVDRNLQYISEITGRNELSLLRHQLSELSWAYDDIRNPQKDKRSAEILIKAEKEFEDERLH